MRRVTGIGAAEGFHTVPALRQLALVIPFACSNLRWGIRALPQQTGVYVPRRLNQTNGPVTDTSSDDNCETTSLPLSHR
jgi:hypothetical protein